MDRLSELETPPGEMASVGVKFRPGHSSGRKFLKFIVRTDDAIRPLFELTLSADLHPRFEFRPDGGEGPPSTLAGRGLHRVYREVGHGRPGEKSLLPASIEATGGVVVGRIEEAKDVTLAGDLIERTSKILVDLPASDTPGLRREILTFRWDDGRSEVQDLAWTVNPAIAVVPSALVLKTPGPSREIRAIQLTCSDRPFRILSVKGDGFAEPVVLPVAPSRNHRIDLAFDPSALRAGVRSMIHIETDHSNARNLDLGVLVLSVPEESPR